MKHAAIILMTLLVTAACARAAQTVAVGGPDGKVEFKMVFNQNRPTFAMSFKSWPVIEPSPLGLTLDGLDLTNQVRAGMPTQYEHDETYATRGVHPSARDRHVGWRVPVTHIPSKTKFEIEVRAFDDGAAFRLIIPGGSAKPSRVPDEQTKFILPAGTIAWSHNLRGHYEADYEKKDVAAYQKGEWVGPPFTFKLPKGLGYAAITESALMTYSGMALEADGERGFVIGLGHRQPVSYPYELRYSKEDIEKHSKPAAVNGKITTPWRVIMVGADLNAMVNSDIVNNLAPPADPKLFPEGIKTAWTKPGRAVWKYLDNPSDRGPADPMTTAPATAPATRQRQRTTPDDMKTFSRLAGELGFEYNVLEGFWSRWSDEEIRDLVEYSRKQGVGLFVWVHSNQLFDPANRAALFKRCHDTGIVGLKIDFFDHEHKNVIDLYQAILREAAENQILLDFHGANKPAGESRTWPNEMTREAIRGMEASRMRERAFHNTTVPFTRYVVGPAEYTPVHFGERRGDTTWAHQIATPVVFTTPLLTYGFHPQKMLDSPAREMFKSIPATWDQTIVLPGSEIGESALLARRSGETWFLAVLNGPAAKKLDIPLSFLGKGTYRALTVSDRPGDSAAIDVADNQSFDQSKSISLDLVAGGGYVARFSRASGDSQ